MEKVINFKSESEFIKSIFRIVRGLVDLEIVNDAVLTCIGNIYSKNDITGLVATAYMINNLILPEDGYMDDAIMNKLKLDSGSLSECASLSLIVDSVTDYVVKKTFNGKDKSSEEIANNSTGLYYLVDIDYFEGGSSNINE